MAITVYVGDNGEYLATHAKKYNSGAYLVHKRNYKEFLLYNSSTDITIFTSLVDLPKIDDDTSVLYEILQKADSIVYSPPPKWSDDNDEFNLSSQRMLVMYYLVLINEEKGNVNGLPTNISENDYLNLSNLREHTNEVLWVAGCSISHGVGVEHNEKFGYIIAKTLKIPLISITKGGSSIEWSADQILRSDIRKGDTIVWGLTSEYRAPKWNHHKHTVDGEHSTLLLVDETRMYKAVTSIYQVINFCNKIGAKLLILPLICSEQLRIYLKDELNYHQLQYQTKPIDYGDDNSHPGPKQHNQWAQYCLRVLNN